jgi:flagellar hook-associated protein 2
MSGITFTGLASGIDTASIVDQLVAVERIPISRLEQRKSYAQTRISTLNDLSTKLKALKTAAQKLDLASELKPLAAKTTDENKVALTGTPSVAGSWRVQVTALATTETTKSRGFATKDAGAVSAGTLSITVGTDAAVPITYSATDSLDDIAARINGTDARVNAAVVHDGSQYRLVINGSETGAVNAVTFADDGGLGMADVGAEVSAATDAALTVGGLPVTRPGNTVEGIVPGVTLDLRAVGEATITAARDGDAQKAAVQGFVDAYNAVQSVVGRELSYNGTAKSEASLFGDSALQGLQRRLGGIVASAFPNGLESTSLRDFGITLQNTGQLTLDAAKFTAAVDADPAKLEALFVGSGAALATQMSDLATEYTQSGTGTLESKASGLRSLMTGFDKQMTRIEDNATALGDRLRLQFSRLEQLMSNMQTQLSYLTKIGA